MEPTNEQLWQTLQKRMSEMNERKTLLPKIKESRKETLIWSLQCNRSRNQPLNRRTRTIEESYQKARQQWDKLIARYRTLASNEENHLKDALDRVEQDIKNKGAYDLDLEDHRSAIRSSMLTLENEKQTVLKPLEAGKNSLS